MSVLAKNNIWIWPFICSLICYITCANFSSEICSNIHYYGGLHHLSLGLYGMLGSV